MRVGNAAARFFSVLMITCLLVMGFSSLALSVSDPFPPKNSTPTVEDFLPNPDDTYYCAPTGNNITGDGSIDKPWLDLRGADGVVTAGDLIYLRGGTYPTVGFRDNYSRSVNMIATNGTSQNPLVITNYPGEIAIFDEQNYWVMSLQGDHQKLIGTQVGSDYGIKVTGGITFHGNDVQVSGVEFIGGGDGGWDFNPMMLGTYALVVVSNGIISHNYFHDSESLCGSPTGKDTCTPLRMANIRTFYTENLLVEYNIFSNNTTGDAGCVYFKDSTQNATVRYNSVYNQTGDFVRYFGQDGRGMGHNNLEIHHNLVNGASNFVNLRSDYGENVTIHNNVALDIRKAFLYYLNLGNDPVNDDGAIYNNIIDGFAVDDGWHVNSEINDNLPDLWDYNIWYSSDQRSVIDSGNGNSVLNFKSGYFGNAIDAADFVTYSLVNMSATVADDYIGLNNGRFGDNRGGFTFDGEPPTDVKPAAPGGLKISK